MQLIKVGSECLRKGYLWCSWMERLSETLQWAATGASILGSLKYHIDQRCRLKSAYENWFTIQAGWEVELDPKAQIPRLIIFLITSATQIKIMSVVDYMLNPSDKLYHKWQSPTSCWIKAYLFGIYFYNNLNRQVNPRNYRPFAFSEIIFVCNLVLKFTKIILN